MLAEAELFPSFFGARSRLGKNGGLYITGAWCSSSRTS
jgi:hypothetical protein